MARTRVEAGTELTKQERANMLREKLMYNSGRFLYRQNTIEKIRSAAYERTDPFSLDNCALNIDLPEDLERIYAVNENGELIQPFAGKTEFTDDEIIDLADNKEEKYYYIQAGDHIPMLIVSGKLAQPEKELPQAIKQLEWRIPPQKEKQKRDYQMIGWKLDHQLMDEMSQLYGQKVGPHGTHKFRNYTEEITCAMQEKKGERELNYPVLPGFSDKDMIGLTMAAMGNPQVSGESYLYGDPKSNAVATIGITAADHEQRRAATDGMAPFMVQSRNAVTKALKAYQQGDIQPLAEQIARGVDAVGLSANFPFNFQTTAVGGLYPAMLLHQMLGNHPELKEAAQDFARKNGLGQEFQRGLENCRRANTLVELKREELEARRALCDPEGLDPEVKASYEKTVAVAELVDADLLQQPHAPTETALRYQNEGVDYANRQFNEKKIDLAEYTSLKQGACTATQLTEKECVQSALMGLLNEERGLERLKESMTEERVKGLLEGTKKGEEVIEELKSEKLLDQSGLDKKGLYFSSDDQVKSVQQVQEEQESRLIWAMDVLDCKKSDLQSLAIRKGVSLATYTQMVAEMVPPIAEKRPTSLDAISAKYRGIPEPEPLQMSVMERFFNSVKKFFTGRPLDKVAAYEQRQAEYDAIQAEGAKEVLAYPNRITEYLRQVRNQKDKYKEALETFKQKAPQKTEKEELSDRMAENYQVLYSDKASLRGREDALQEIIEDQGKLKQMEENEPVDFNAHMEADLQTLKNPEASVEEIQKAMSDLLTCRAFREAQVESEPQKSFEANREFLSQQPSFKEVLSHFHAADYEGMNPTQLSDVLSAQLSVEDERLAREKQVPQAEVQVQKAPEEKELQAEGKVLN